MLGLLPEISGTDCPDVIEHPDKAIEAALKPIIFRKSRRFVRPIISFLYIISVPYSALRILDKIGHTREKVKIKNHSFYPPNLL
jgi:hypothetical protein